MSLLSWDKPDKIVSFEQRQNDHRADSAPPGVYVPNMSEEDNLKWKAKYIGGETPRVEIRTSEFGCQMVLTVFADKLFSISTNGKIWFDYGLYQKIGLAIFEAQESIRRKLKNEQSNS